MANDGQVRVVVVEDDVSVAQLLREVCEALGWTVDLAHDGQTGLDVVRAKKPDLILLDVMMAPLDGVGVLAAMRRDPDLRDTTILVVTAVPEPELEQKVLALGAADVIHKPFRVYELQARARLAVEEARFRRAERAGKPSPAAGPRPRLGKIEPESELKGGLAQAVQNAKDRAQRLLCIVIRFESIRELLNAGLNDALAARHEFLERTRRALRSADRLFELGADRAVVLAVGADRTIAVPLLRRLGDQAEAVRVGQRDLKLELRFGVALFPSDVTDGEGLLVAAIDALPAS
jgi:CheY-like chemotaxis protein